MPGKKPRSLLFYIIIANVFGLILFSAYFYSIHINNAWKISATGYLIGHDFTNFYLAPIIAFSGKIRILFDIYGGDYMRFVHAYFGKKEVTDIFVWAYPVHAILLFAPFSLFPYPVALALWLASTFAAMAYVVLKHIKHESRWLALGLLALSPGALLNITLGHVGFLIAACFLGCALLMEKRPWLSGALLGLMSIKPHMAFALPFAILSRGLWKPLIAAFLTIAGLVGFSILLFGIEPWISYLTVTVPFHVHLLDLYKGIFIFMTPSVKASLWHYGLSDGKATILQFVVAVPILAVACYAVRRTHDSVLRAVILAAATPLITPQIFDYDLPLTAAAIVLRLFSPGAELKPWQNICYALGWLLPVLVFAVNVRGFYIAPFISLLFFVACVTEAFEAPDNKSALKGA